MQTVHSPANLKNNNSYPEGFYLFFISSSKTGISILKVKIFSLNIDFCILRNTHFRFKSRKFLGALRNINALSVSSSIDLKMQVRCARPRPPEVSARLKKT